MTDDLIFIYHSESWFISAFLNTSKINEDQISSQIQSLINSKLGGLTDADIYKKELKDELLEMARNISLNCKWVPYVDNFPYKDENSEREYNVLGFFQFKVEYFKDNPAKKEKIRPMLVQQMPYIVLNTLKEFSQKPGNDGIFLDLESPIFIFVTSNKYS